MRSSACSSAAGGARSAVALPPRLCRAQYIWLSTQQEAHDIEARGQLPQHLGRTGGHQGVGGRQLAGPAVELVEEAGEIHRGVRPQPGAHGRALATRGAGEGARVDVDQVQLVVPRAQRLEVEIVGVAGAQQAEPAARRRGQRQQLGGHPLAVAGIAVPQVADVPVAPRLGLPRAFEEPWLAAGHRLLPTIPERR
jgi:hypothetical protein